MPNSPAIHMPVAQWILNPFSSGSLTDTKRRNHLSASVFEALRILKSAYWNGHISATREATEYICDLTEVLGAQADFENED
jgi:hypothetical protein